MYSLTVSTLQAQLHYPETAKGTQTDNYHGTTVADPYRWLENDNSDSTKAWVIDENKVTSAFLSTIPFREALRKRLTSVYNYERFTIPQSNNGYLYYSRNDGLQNQSVVYRQKGLKGVPEVVIDPNTFSASGTSPLTDFEVSTDGKYAAFGKSSGGSDWHTYYVMELATKKMLPDSIAWVKVSNLSWQKNGFYYSRYPEPKDGSKLSNKNENHQVWYHAVGTEQSADRLIYQDTANLQRFHQTEASEDERFVLLVVSDRGKGLEGNALFFKDAKEPDAPFKPVVKEVGEFTYDFVESTPDGKILIRTNDHAPNNKLMLVDPKNPDMAKWKTVIPETSEPLESVSYSGGKLFVTYLKDVTSRIYVYSVSGKKEGKVKLPGLGTAGGFGGRLTDKYVFYSFASFNFPTRIYQYDIATGKSTLFRKPAIDFKADDYETTQEFYPSKDGTKIPMFLIHKKGLVKNGNNPTLLYAYGGFNISIGPAFSPAIVPWLEQGGLYAIANLRGGSEYGEKWHQAGMLDKKQNVFDDFIAAAEYLIAQKYTSPEKLAIRGGSNGGLLIGTVINQRPELFKVAIPEVGVMDMLRFHKFTIGWNWQPEYGSSDNAKDFPNLYGYSPLHNIKGELNYPATLVTTADHDDRVVPAHSFKYIATLQDKYKGKNPVLIRIDTNSGHGSSNISKYIAASTDIYSFVLYNMGLSYQ